MNYNTNSFPVVTESDKHWAAATHWGGMLLAICTAWLVGFAGFLVPLMILILRGRDSAFVSQHAKESMNFNLSMFIYAVIGLVIGLILFGGTILTLGLGLIVSIPGAFVLLVAYCVLAVTWVICSVLGTVAAYDSKPYRYPFTIRLIR